MRPRALGAQYGLLTSRLRNFASGLYRARTNSRQRSTILVPTAPRRNDVDGAEVAFLRRRATDVVAAFDEAPRMASPSFATAIRAAAYEEVTKGEGGDER